MNVEELEPQAVDSSEVQEAQQDPETIVEPEASDTTIDEPNWFERNMKTTAITSALLVV